MATPAAVHTNHAHAPAGGKYFVPEPSAWPFVLTFALVICIISGWGYLEDHSLGPVPAYGGAALAIYIIFRWVRGVCLESEGGLYNTQVGMTYRMGMAWFIFSEVMFFAAFFGALWYAREMSIPWLSGEGATVALGCLFLYFQVTEYVHAFHELNLTMHSGVYGSTFFMLTGFHGFHVTLGTLMLAIIAVRLMLGHFKPDSHFGFEGVAWYWHFVDVVWIGLFIFVYVA